MSNGISAEVEREITEFRARLGMSIVIKSGQALAGLSIVAIIAAGCSDIWAGTKGATLETTRMVFTSVLPLLGTWVGTVLAFYFTKEGLETASRTTIAAVRSGMEKLEQLLVRDKMIATTAIAALHLAEGETLAAATFGRIQKVFAKPVPGTTKKVTRVPVFDANGRAVGILHDSTWLALQNVALRAKTALEDATTLATMFEAAKKAEPPIDFEAMITRTVAWIAEGRTLADAKRRMEAVADCQDVFVTASGLAEDRIVGWLPNIVIARESRA